MTADEGAALFLAALREHTKTGGDQMPYILGFVYYFTAIAFIAVISIMIY
jgi:hypothetical protein